MSSRYHPIQRQEGSREIGTRLHDLVPHPFGNHSHHHRVTTQTDRETLIAAWSDAELIVDAENRPAWLEARRTRLTSTDIAKAMTPAGRAQVIQEKLFGLERSDNAAFKHGRDRESEIARQAEQRYGVHPNRFLFDGNGYSATPDGIGDDRELGEYKTSVDPKPRTFPRIYRDQVFLAQYVFGAERTLIGWEQHRNGVPTDLEPDFWFIPRDDDRIAELLQVGSELADFLEIERLTLAY